MKTTLQNSFFRIGFCALALLVGLTSFAQAGQKVNGNISSSIQGIAETMNTFVAPPANFDFGGERDVVISVTYNGFTTAAQIAFQYAVDIWASQLTSNVPILIDATWSDLPGNTLGSAGAEGFWYNFADAPNTNTYYPSALADKIAGYDLDPGYPDVVANFDSGTDWYFGTDGNPSFNEFDFVSVVLHELGHGLGVQGSADKIGSSGSLGLGTFSYPIIYDVYVENGSGLAITSFTNPSSTLGTQLTGNSLYWNGANALAGNAGISPRMYAPSSWEPGSSYSHLNESTYSEGNANSLMTPQIGYSEAIHSPGPIILGLMADIGWDVEETGGGDCQMTAVGMESPTCLDGNPIIQMTFSIDGGCTINEICSSANGGAFTCEDVSDIGFADGGVANFNAALANTDYEFYYTLSDGTQSGSFFYSNGSCDDVETICDCASTEHTIGVLTWLGDGYADNSAYEWEGQVVDFDCETWGYDCGDIIGSPTDDPYNTCDGFLPPNNGCAGGGCEMTAVGMESPTCVDNNPIIQMTFSISGGCFINEICSSANGGAFTCEDVSAIEFVDGGVANFNAALANTNYEFYYTLSDGSQSDSFFYSNGSCDDVETICDCAGTEHTIGVLTWLGDGYADNSAYEWEGQVVDFDCETWGYDCGDILGSPADDPYNTCDGGLPPSNGCSGGDDCSYNGIDVYIDGCGESLTDIMFFEFDFEGDCMVFEICYESTFSEVEGCFDLTEENLGSGDVWGINSLGEGLWNFYYSLDDGSSSPVGSLTITSCVQVLGCTNTYATNYNSNADVEDGSCTYDDTICDCAGTEHTIGVLVWLMDGYGDIGGSEFPWEGQNVDFNCATWGYDCGDIEDAPSVDPNNVCGGDLPPNNGCEIIETPGCMDSEACNYDDDATVDDGSCDYDSCAGCMNPSACNYDADAILEDGSCEFDSCAGCTNPNACNYDDDAELEDGSCEFMSCAGCTDDEACNYDEDAILENGSCDYSCYGCTDSDALNYDSAATIDDGTCSFEEVDGCTDNGACNYNPFATDDDGSCEYETCAGCTDFLACNFDIDALFEDGSCDYSCYGCTDSDALNYNPNATIDDGTCSYEVVDGCTDVNACNYDPFATDDDGSCEYQSCLGCTDPLADNYDPTATIDDGSCLFGGIEGCTDSEALNYDATASIDDGSCIFTCDFPDISYTPFCELDEPAVYYIEMDISDLGNGSPYLVTNNANDDEFELSFNGSIEIGPFGNDIEVVILVSSLALDGCLVSSSPQINNCDVSVEEYDTSTFAIYPNPNNGQFAIQSNNFEGKAILEVLDATGKLVESRELVLNSDQTHTMDMSNLANGMYVVRLRSTETVAVDQLIIRR
jgi:hypothetical protein